MNRSPAVLPRQIDELGWGILDGRALDIRWRYVWHHGQWWSWMPNSTWRIWDGATWISEPDVQAADRKFTIDLLRRSSTSQTRTY